MHIIFNDSIITDTTAEKRKDIDEVMAGLLESVGRKGQGKGKATAHGMAVTRTDSSTNGLG